MGHLAVPVETVKATPLLAVPPTVTTTLPVVALVGTGETMVVAPQLVGVAAVPLNVTVLVPCDEPKFVPVIVTKVPTAPDVGFRLVMLGAVAVVTVNVIPLLALPPTVTTTYPVAAPAGTGATMLVAPQFVGVAVVPLNVTVLVPCDEPKFVPVIVTGVPTRPEVGSRLVMLGVAVSGARSWALTQWFSAMRDRQEQLRFIGTEFSRKEAALGPGKKVPGFG